MSIYNIVKPIIKQKYAFPAFSGQLLRIARQKENLTQAQLARAAFISQASISEMETGAYADVSANALARVAAALRTPIDRFFNHGRKDGIRNTGISRKRKIRSRR